MPKRYSLSVGVNRVDPKQYDGQWDGFLPCCEKDAQDVDNLLKSAGYDKRTLLKTSKATRANVLKAIKSASKSLKKGDLFVIYYSGHGGQVADINGDEEDANDETWCLHDGQLIDDEIYYSFSSFAEGVRILMISDSCHSGTVSKVAMLNSSETAGPLKKKLYKFMPEEVVGKAYLKKRELYDKVQMDDIMKISNPSNKDYAHNIRASVKLISGCQDNQYSQAGAINSVFTAMMFRVWRNGMFNGNYKAFHKKIVDLMPPDQTPNLYDVGAKDPDFNMQRPFANSK